MDRAPFEPVRPQKSRRGTADDWCHLLCGQHTSARPAKRELEANRNISEPVFHREANEERVVLPSMLLEFDLWRTHFLARVSDPDPWVKRPSCAVGYFLFVVRPLYQPVREHPVDDYV